MNPLDYQRFQPGSRLRVNREHPHEGKRGLKVAAIEVDSIGIVATV